MLPGITLAATLLVASPAPGPAASPAAPALVATPAPVVHCQVPCGIYGDHLRVEMLTENTATIEKAMKQIEELGAADAPNWNQLVRWITTKDAYAQRIQDQVSAYWLAQRIKAPKAAPGAPEFEAQNGAYMTQLVMAHRLTTFAMKCKQTTDLANIQGLRDSLEGLKGAYFSPEDLEHIHGAEHEEGGHDHKDGDHDHK